MWLKMLLEVALEVPLVIAKGLASGQLERAGGVVRDIASKHVVMWLREGGQIASNTDLAGGLLKTVLQASSGGMASTLTGAVKSGGYGSLPLHDNAGITGTYEPSWNCRRHWCAKPRRYCHIDGNPASRSK